MYCSHNNYKVADKKSSNGIYTPFPFSFFLFHKKKRKHNLQKWNQQSICTSFLSFLGIITLQLCMRSYTWKWRNRYRILYLKPIMMLWTWFSPTPIPFLPIFPRIIFDSSAIIIAKNGKTRHSDTSHLQKQFPLVRIL